MQMCIGSRADCAACTVSFGFTAAAKIVLQTDTAQLQPEHPDVFYVLHNKPVMKAAYDHSAHLLFLSNKQSHTSHDMTSRFVSAAYC